MPAKTNPSAVGNPSAPKMPGEVVRGLVSLWIIIHLLGVGLALITNTGMGQSELVSRIKRAPPVYDYLYALWLDTPHAHRLTNGEYDGDYTIETDLVHTDGKTETVNLEPADAHGERLERYHALARVMAPADMESPDMSMLSQLGGALLRKLKADGVNEVVFRIRRHAPLSMADAAASDVGQRNPSAPRTYSTLVTASVTLNSVGEPQVQVKSQSARDVAPVTNPNNANPNSASPKGASPKSSSQPNRQFKPAPMSPSQPPRMLTLPSVNLDGSNNPPGNPSKLTPPANNPAPTETK